MQIGIHYWQREVSAFLYNLFPAHQSFMREAAFTYIFQNEETKAQSGKVCWAPTVGLEVWKIGPMHYIHVSLTGKLQHLETFSLRNIYHRHIRGHNITYVFLISWFQGLSRNLMDSKNCTGCNYKARGWTYINQAEKMIPHLYRYTVCQREARGSTER